MAISIRPVRLHKGPSDGLLSVASHDTAISGGELYVWDGSEDRNSFVHAATALRELPAEQAQRERQRVEAWMEADLVTVPGSAVKVPAPMSDLIGIPPWRINAWVQVTMYGVTI